MKKGVQYNVGGGGKITCGPAWFGPYRREYKSWSNFIMADSYPHALRQFLRLKVRHRQIDARPRFGKAFVVAHGSWRLANRFMAGVA